MLADTAQRIDRWEERVEELEKRLEMYPDDIDAAIDLLEAKEQLNFAWQDDEAEYNYALEMQEFNADGSLRYY